VEPVDGLRRLAHLLSGEADHATDGRPSRRPWRGRRSDDHQLQAVLGPALERLRRTFTNRASYHHFWREHPAFCDPDIWTPEVEAYLDYDLVGEPPLLRSGVSLDAVRRDSQDTLGDSARHALEPVDRPLVLLRAASGIFAQPPGLYPDDFVVAAASTGASTTTRLSKAPITTRLCVAPEARRGSPRTAADGNSSSAPPAGSWRSWRAAPRFPLKRMKPNVLLRRVPANPEAEQVPQAHDPNQRGARHDGKMAKPAAEHDLGRSLGVDMGPTVSGSRVIHRDTGERVRSLPDAAARTTSRSVKIPPAPGPA
jgi:hypothetical protein